MDFPDPAYSPSYFMRNGFSRRVFDLVIAGSATVILAPAMLVIAVLIRRESPGPVLFRQKRLGLHGRPFSIYKFRTMLHGAPPVFNSDGSMYVGDEDPRLTRVGRFLRETTLDEIPQVFNVLRGEMSIVGPRPDTVEQLEAYDELMRRKLEVKPGMASIALLHGRNSLGWRERVRLEVDYIERSSLIGDLDIFLRGLLALVLRRGVYNPPPKTPDQTDVPDRTHRPPFFTDRQI
jgi:undecaprenyl phosphate N,N'-diacetylbacillosamine 1-phosphate transferase